MKKPLMLVAALALASAPARSATTWESFDRLPGATPVRVRVRENERIYFRLTPHAPLIVTVDGPGKLRVITRAELPRGSADLARYHVRATEGATVFEELSTESSAASDVKVVGSPTVVGKSRRMTFDVPSGRHRVELTLRGADAALVRLQRSGSSKGEEPMVSLTPIVASRSVSVTEGEKIVPYYSVQAGQPVRIRVVGPTTLELLTRLDFDASMRGTQAYHLRLVELNRTLRQIELRTTKAAAASYTNLPDRVPSKFDRVKVPVGEGLHEISVELIRPARGSAEIHARIPAPAVGNEE